MFQPRALTSIKPGQKKAKKTSLGQPKKPPELVLTMQASRAQALIDEDEDIEDLVGSSQCQKWPRTESPPPPSPIMDLTEGDLTPRSLSRPGILNPKE